ncbi:hypothetical protein [Synechococcus sp. PROS-7-1]|uniref:hypothetical protein n=1 Tax=Synechococcus sp. PROS-7-1 TaxID=1442556 RepID=UPI001648CBF9|nr:hypothetical protein [Synechococcus sp. PROS-7-1]
MIAYLILCTLLVPANLWATITPHLHSEVSMRLLHALSTAVLIPPLVSLWRQRRSVQPLPALLFAPFSVVLVVVNTHIALMGMGVRFGWIDHLFLTIACLAVIAFYLLTGDEAGAVDPRNEGIA